MIEAIIHSYIADLRQLRKHEAAFERYAFTLSADKKNDVNQLNRLRIGVGLLNDLIIPDDHTLVKRLIREEVIHRNAGTENYGFEVIYLLYYLLSEFGVIEDIWDFAALKFDGTMDADSGFETGFFLTYGKENLRRFLQRSSHKLKDKIYHRIFFDETAYSNKDGQAYKDQQAAYFGLKLPLTDEPRDYLWIQEKKGFPESFDNWKKSTDLSDEWNARNYVQYAEYLGDENEIERAMQNYITAFPTTWSASQYKKQLRKKRNKNILETMAGWFKMG